MKTSYSMHYNAYSKTKGRERAMSRHSYSRAEGIGIAPVVESEDVARLQAETKHPAFQERTKCLFRAA